VSDSGQDNPNDPFSGLPFFGDIGKLLGGGNDGGPINWDAARQFAVGLATGGASEPNVDPQLRVQLAKLSRIAELQVAQATGLGLTVNGHVPVVTPVTKSQWANTTLDDYKPLIEHLASGLNADAPPDNEDPAATLLSGIMKMIGPTMMAMSAGSMVGHLSTMALGSYHLPVPRRAAAELAIVGPNVADFIDEWSVDADDVGLWICLHELLHHAVFNIDHVRERIMDLLQSFAAGFQQADAGALEQKLGNFEPSVDLEGMQQQMQQIFGDPEMLLGAMRTPAQEAIVPELESLLAVLVGWVDHHLDAIGQHLIGGHQQITEAMRRRRVSAGPQDRFVEKMLGLDLRRDLLERGQSFIAGVVERGGEDQLAKLWAKADHLPTPNEVDAPGLWIARIDLPDLNEPSASSDE